MAATLNRLRGKLSSDYLVEGTPQELEARKALARLLRSKEALDPELRASLADLVDPPEWEQRKFKIVFQRQGRSDLVAHTQIVEHVWAAMSKGQRYTDAMKAAAAKFSKSEDMIKTLWRRYRPLFEAIHGSPKSQGK